MKILSWNVNGLKSIVKKDFKNIVSKLDEDIICIQEIKTRTGIKGFELEGYHAYYNLSIISGYSGVAIFVKKKPNKVYKGLKLEETQEFDRDTQTRVLTLEYNDFYIVNVYVPHPQSRNVRKEYRDEFNENFINFIKQLNKRVIICGDFNVTHRDIDIYEKNINKEEFLIEQRASFDELLSTGLVDTFRYMHPQMRKYSLKAGKIQKLETDKFGWRIDYILVSESMKKEIREANILNEIEGSDHCPVELVLKETCNNSELGDTWENYDFTKAEEKLLKMQCELTKATFSNQTRKRIKIQEEIVNSHEAKMLAVKQVSENNKTSAGIDNILWERAADKMKAATYLNTAEYKAKPLRQYLFYDRKSGTQRKIAIPTIYDRAMQTLYYYALEPVIEAKADRKSFAFRKGKSQSLIHAFIIKALTDENPPKWILTSKIVPYNDLNTKQWIIQNIPMNKQILRQFLKAKYIFNGALFETDSNCNINTLAGNAILDGIQKELYNIQGKTVKDFYNGYCLRYADEIIITARTKQDAIHMQEILKEFAIKRGLQLSENETKIANIEEGFEFLSRFYYKINERIKCIPSQKAVEEFKQEIKFLILNNKDRWTTKELIDNTNRKIINFTSYHKIEEATETFRHLDVIINAVLLKMVKENHPDLTINQLKSKYWKKDIQGRYIFTTPDKRNICVKNMADTVLTEEKQIDLKKNIFLDRKYFEELQENSNIQNVKGKYKKIYDMQDGKCYYCSKEIKMTDEKKIVTENKKPKYIHHDCENQIITKINTSESIDHIITARELLKEITDEREEIKIDSKFKNLYIFFHNTRRNKIRLSFEDMEKILNFKLCSSAYKYKSYFYNKEIGESWRTQGFEIRNVDLERKEIAFKRVENKNKINVPTVLYRTNLPEEAVEEANNFFIHFIEKYRLR